VPILSKSSTLEVSDADAHRGDERLIAEESPSTFLPPDKDDGPLYEIIVHFGKHTTFNYGPWADRWVMFTGVARNFDWVVGPKWKNLWHYFGDVFR